MVMVVHILDFWRCLIVLLCLVNWAFSEKKTWQQEHSYGVFFSCTSLKCLVIADLVPNSALHSTLEHSKGFFLSWTETMCTSRDDFVPNIFWQWLHSKCLIFLWTLSKCFLAAILVWKHRLHSGQGNGFSPLCTNLLCNFRFQAFAKVLGHSGQEIFVTGFLPGN